MIITPVILTDTSVSQEMWCLITTIQFGKEWRRFSCNFCSQVSIWQETNWWQKLTEPFQPPIKRSPKVPISVKLYRHFPFLTNIFLKYLPPGHVFLCTVTSIVLPLIQIFMVLLSTSGCSLSWGLRLVQRSRMLYPAACVVSIAYSL